MIHILRQLNHYSNLLVISAEGNNFRTDISKYFIHSYDNRIIHNSQIVCDWEFVRHTSKEKDIGYHLFFAIVAQTSGQEMQSNVHRVPKMVDNEYNSIEAAARIHNAITIFMSRTSQF